MPNDWYLDHNEPMFPALHLFGKKAGICASIYSQSRQRSGPLFCFRTDNCHPLDTQVCCEWLTEHWEALAIQQIRAMHLHQTRQHSASPWKTHRHTSPLHQCNHWPHVLTLRPLVAVYSSSTVVQAAPVAKEHSAIDHIVRAKGNIYWRVRQYRNEDFQALVQLQTESFFTPPPLPMLKQLSWLNFRAEVLDGLKKKETTLSNDSFQIFIAEDITEVVNNNSAAQPAPNTSQPSSDNSSWWCDDTCMPLGPPQLGLQYMETPGQAKDSQPTGTLVGVVEVACLDESEVVQALPPGTETYGYISSMAVAVPTRRQGLAHALLHTAHKQSLAWELEDLTLHVYDDNLPAVKLYEKWGFKQIRKDPGWKKLAGGRVRLLMHQRVKQSQP